MQRINNVKKTTSICLGFLLGVVSTMTHAGGWISAVNDKPPAPPITPLCQGLLDRLNHYSWPDKQHQQCYRDVVVSSPELKEPPWEELDPREHMDLLVRLLRYWSGPKNYFRSPPPSAQDSAQHDRAQSFIDEGGRMLLWRARILDHYLIEEGGSEAPPGEQAIVQLRTKKPTTSEAQQACPGKPLLDWQSTVFFAAPDLSGPDPHVPGGSFAIMSTSSLMLYQGVPYFIDEYHSIWESIPARGLMGLCNFKFVGEKK